MYTDFFGGAFYWSSFVWKARKDILKIHTRQWTPPPSDTFLEKLVDKCVGMFVLKMKNYSSLKHCQTIRTGTLAAAFHVSLLPRILWCRHQSCVLGSRSMCTAAAISANLRFLTETCARCWLHCDHKQRLCVCDVKDSACFTEVYLE